MRIENYIYIYKESNNDMLLEVYIDYFSNINENKEKIISIFEKKFKYDFLESTQLLINNNYLYPTSMILVNSIDTLAKHYTGNFSHSNIKVNFKKFFKEKLANKLLEKNSKVELETFVEQFYENFRCPIIHSNSTPIYFTIDDEISNVCFQNNILVINLEYLRNSIGEALEEYINLLRTDSTYFDKFIKVQKKIYGIDKDLKRKKENTSK